MKVTIDEKACKKHGMSIEQVLFALTIRAGDVKNTLKEMLEKEIVVKKEGQYLITQRWSGIVDEIICDSSEKARNDEDLQELAMQIQECFPKLRMKDRTGKETPYYFRCNRTEITKHLKMFYENYGNDANISFEDILEATKRYVEEYSKKNYEGMRLAKYFIWKNDKKPKDDETMHVEQLSDLATYLENRSEEEEVVTNDNWTLKIL